MKTKKHTIKYDGIAYGASVKNGKVEYYREYYIKAYPICKIVYTEKISYSDYIEAL